VSSLIEIWGFENEVETRATDDMVKRIRKKLSDSGSTLKIQTVWGYGFKIEDKEGFNEEEYNKMENIQI